MGKYFYDEDYCYSHSKTINAVGQTPYVYNYIADRANKMQME